MENNNLTVYKQIARDALMSWNGLSEEEATKKVQESSNEELEQQVYAEGSIDYAIKGFQKYSQEYLKNKHGYGEPITDHDVELFKEVVMTGKYRYGSVQDFYDIMRNKMGIDLDRSNVENMVLSVLSTIHDGWVKDNQKKFFARDKKYQHMPIELIGWKEAKSDLLFLKPMLEEMHIMEFYPYLSTEEDLESAYNKRVQAFLEENGITEVSKLSEQISKGAEFYPALEGQEDIIKALQDTKFVEEQVVSGIRDKGIGTNEQISQQLFGEKAIEGTEELESLRAQKQELVEQEKTISEAEKLIEAKENQGPNLDE